jgi:hypothetical protein
MNAESIFATFNTDFDSASEVLIEGLKLVEDKIRVELRKAQHENDRHCAEIDRLNRCPDCHQDEDWEAEMEDLYEDEATSAETVDRLDGQLATIEDAISCLTWGGR